MSQVQLTDNMRLLTTQEPCEGKRKPPNENHPKLGLNYLHFMWLSTANIPQLNTCGFDFMRIFTDNKTQ